jgi:tripartite-type tricarboxylate transporter receptor subunit TctC
MVGRRFTGGGIASQAAHDRKTRGGRMNLLQRRRFLHLAVGAVALPALPSTALAQAYPTRPVRIIVAFAAGGPGEIAARLIGQWLSERLGQPFIVEFRPGAGTNIGTEFVVRAAPDGYTLLLAVAANVINMTLYDKLSFNFLRDMAPVAGIHREPLIVVVNPSVPAATISELIAYAKAHPRKLSMATGGIGVASHVSGELFKMMAGVEMTNVPYRSTGLGLTDMLGGQVQVMFAPMSPAIQHIKAGTLRALAVTTTTRSIIFPDVPTVSESVGSYEASSWYGICAPRNTPAEIIDRLNKEINAGLADAKIKARLADLGTEALPGSPADFGNLLASETEKWAKVIKFADIRRE